MENDFFAAGENPSANLPQKIPLIFCAESACVLYGTALFYLKRPKHAFLQKTNGKMCLSAARRAAFSEKMRRLGDFSIFISRAEGFYLSLIEY